MGSSASTYYSHADDQNNARPDRLTKNLRYYIERKFASQNNLANTLQLQGTRAQGSEGAALLAEAVTAYRAALEVRTRADHPVDWAMTQENIAICEEARAAHDSCTDPRAALTAALQAVDNALTVFNPDHTPYNHTKATRLRDHVRAALDALPRG